MYSNKKYMTPNLRTITFMKRLNQLLLSPPLLFCSYRDFHCPALSCAEIGGRRREDGTRFSLFLPPPTSPNFVRSSQFERGRKLKTCTVRGRTLPGQARKMRSKIWPPGGVRSEGWGTIFRAPVRAILCFTGSISRRRSDSQDRFPPLYRIPPSFLPG